MKYRIPIGLEANAPWNDPPMDTCGRCGGCGKVYVVALDAYQTKEVTERAYKAAPYESDDPSEWIQWDEHWCPDCDGSGEVAA